MPTVFATAIGLQGHPRYRNSKRKVLELAGSVATLKNSVGLWGYLPILLLQVFQLVIRRCDITVLVYSMHGHSDEEHPEREFEHSDVQ